MLRIGQSFLIIIILSAFGLIISQQPAALLKLSASDDSPYRSGYDHGCDDAAISDPSDRYINQLGKGPSFHTEEFMSGYYNGVNACSNGVDDENADNNAADGNLRVIASLDMGTYGNHYCASRTFDMRVHVQSELAQEKIVDQETTFSGLDVASDSSFRVCVCMVMNLICQAVKPQ